jgi:hypothetical protein
MKKSTKTTRTTQNLDTRALAATRGAGQVGGAGYGLHGASLGGGGAAIEATGIIGGTGYGLEGTSIGGAGFGVQGVGIAGGGASPAQQP